MDEFVIFVEIKEQTKNEALTWLVVEALMQLFWIVLLTGRRRSGRRRMSQSQIVFAFAAHSVGISGTAVPLHPDPSVFTQVADDAAFSGRISVLSSVERRKFDSSFEIISFN
jgi:hypothetical protein